MLARDASDALSLLGERFGEERRRVRLPREVVVGEEEDKCLASATETLDLRQERLEAGEELRSPLGGVEVVGERGGGPAERVEPPPRVATRGEQELRPANGGVQLVVADRHLPAREEAEHRPLLGRLRPFHRTHPVADRVPRHGSGSTRASVRGNVRIPLTSAGPRSRPPNRRPIGVGMGGARRLLYALAGLLAALTVPATAGAADPAPAVSAVPAKHASSPSWAAPQIAS